MFRSAVPLPARLDSSRRAERLEGRQHGGLIWQTCGRHADKLRTVCGWTRRERHLLRQTLSQLALLVAVDQLRIFVLRHITGVVDSVPVPPGARTRHAL